MPALELKPLSTLPRSKKAYRIDALGNIQRNPASATNHLINVLVSPVTRPDYTKIFEPDAVNSQEQECYQISAGELFLFSPGCVIRNGARVWVPQLTNIWESLNISKEKVRFVTPGNRLDSLIPYTVYKLGIASRSTFVAIEQNGDPYSVLIPTMEILRFYYSGSSKLNQAIFSSKLLDLDELLNLEKCFFDKDSKRLTVCLRQDYPDDDAAMLGHWYVDEYAHKQVLNVWNALIKFSQMQNFNYLPLEIGFPFVGTTQLQGQGIDLPTPEGIERKRKLILTLIKCSHPRPFEKLIHTRDNRAGPGTKDIPGPEPKPTAGYHQRIVVHSDKSATDGGDNEGINDPFANPSLGVQPKIIKLSAHRFPEIEIESHVKEHSTHRHDPDASGSDDEFPNQSTSEPAAGDTDTAGICIVPTEDPDKGNADKLREVESLPITFKTFKKVVEELETLETIKSTTEILIDPVITKDGQHMSQFSSTFIDHRAIKWSTVAEGGRARQRRAMVVKVQAERGTHYLLEVERKTYGGDDDNPHFDREFATYLFSNKEKCEAINENTIKLLLTTLAESCFRKYKETFKKLGFIVKAKKHQGSVCERAQLIETSMIAIWASTIANPDGEKAKE